MAEQSLFNWVSPEENTADKLENENEAPTTSMTYYPMTRLKKI